MPFFKRNPGAFQGSLKRRGYFEGWYLRHTSRDGGINMAFIPGLSLHEGDRHAFVQVIDGNSGRTWYFRYPAEDFHADKGSFHVRIGDNRFSLDGITAHLESPDGSGDKFAAHIRYSRHILYPRRLWRPGIMGPYSFVPFMECSHDVLSLDHGLQGSITRNGIPGDLTGGRGYIEKDWGTSFPGEWIWLQCHHFKPRDASFLLSLARIPWRGRTFTGLIAYLYSGGKFRLWATYNSGTCRHLSLTDKTLQGSLVRKGETLDFEAEWRTTGRLKAPRQGRMDRIIRESVNSAVSLRYRGREDKVPLDLEGRWAGLEISLNDKSTILPAGDCRSR